MHDRDRAGRAVDRSAAGPSSRRRPAASATPRPGTSDGTTPSTRTWNQSASTAIGPHSDVAPPDRRGQRAAQRAELARHGSGRDRNRIAVDNSTGDSGGSTLQPGRLQPGRQQAGLVDRARRSPRSSGAMRAPGADTAQVDGDGDSTSWAIVDRRLHVEQRRRSRAPAGRRGRAGRRRRGTRGARRRRPGAPTPATSPGRPGSAPGRAAPAPRPTPASSPSCSASDATGNPTPRTGSTIDTVPARRSRTTADCDAVPGGQSSSTSTQLEPGQRRREVVVETGSGAEQRRPHPRPTPPQPAPRRARARDGDLVQRGTPPPTERHDHAGERAERSRSSGQLRPSDTASATRTPATSGTRLAHRHPEQHPDSAPSRRTGSGPASPSSVIDGTSDSRRRRLELHRSGSSAGRPTGGGRRRRGSTPVAWPLPADRRRGAVARRSADGRRRRRPIAVARRRRRGDGRRDRSGRGRRRAAGAERLDHQPRLHRRHRRPPPTADDPRRHRRALDRRQQPVDDPRRQPRDREAGEPGHQRPQRRRAIRTRLSVPGAPALASSFMPTTSVIVIAGFASTNATVDVDQPAARRRASPATPTTPTRSARTPPPGTAAPSA